MPVSPEAFDALALPAMRQKIATITRSQVLTEAIVVGRAELARVMDHDQPSGPH